MSVDNSAAASGGGLYAGATRPVLTNCTIVGNSAGEYGGGLAFSYSRVRWLTQLSGQLGDQIYRTSSTVSVTYCDVQGGFSDVGNKNADPCFVDAAGDYRLAAGSPCIDAGKNSRRPRRRVDLDGDGNTTEPIPFDVLGQLRSAMIRQPLTPAAVRPRWSIWVPTSSERPVSLPISRLSPSV